MTALDAFLGTVDLVTAAAGTERRVGNATIYDEWKDLVSFVPAPSVQQEVTNRGWHFNRIDQAGGNGVNLDLYAIAITQLPSSFATAGALFEHVRKNLGAFLDPSMTDFEPYDPQQDGPRWQSTNPAQVLGAVMRFDMKLGLGSISNLEDGSVICSAYAVEQFWRFTTIYTSGDFDHPVSGHREWGVRPADGSGHLIYTRAADRVTGGAGMGLAPFEALTFAGGHKLWVGFQERLAAFVNDPQQGGSAQVVAPVRHKPQWESVLDLYTPVSPWL